MAFVRVGTSLPRIAAFVLTGCGFLLFTLLLAWANRGLELSDEAFYLLNAKTPDAFSLANTQFGYILKPFLSLTGEDVAGFRRIFISLLAGLGGIASWVWSAKLEAPTEYRIALIAVSSSASLAYYSYWMLTPSYNLLVFVAGLLLIIAIGMLYTSRAIAAAGMMVASAALLAIFGKITSAIAFAAILGSAIIVLNAKDRRVSAFLFIGAIMLVFVLAAAAFFPAQRIAEQLTNYVAFFGPRHAAGDGSLIDLARFSQSSKGIRYFVGLAGLLSIVFLVRRDISPRLNKNLNISIAIYGVISIVTIRPASDTLGLDMGNLAATAGMLATLVCRDYRLGASFFLMLLLPWAAGIGTGNYLPSSVAGFHGGLFAITAAIAVYFATQKSPAFRIAGLALVLGYPALSLSNAIQKPYRVAAPITQQTELVSVNPSGARLRLDFVTAQFIQKLRDVARREGFCAGEPMIDLTGRTPGIAYILGAIPPGFAWLPSGYKFSDDFANYVLGLLSQKTIERSWLVIPAGEPRFPKTIQRFQLSEANTNYRRVAAAMKTPQGLVFDLYAPSAGKICNANAG